MLTECLFFCSAILFNHHPLSVAMSEFPLHSTSSFPYKGIVEPPAFYKIVIWDQMREKQQQPANCANVFVSIVLRANVLNLKLFLFKYVPGSNLDEFAECFEHFHTAQTDADGQFELQLAHTVNQRSFYVHMFPLDRHMQLIHSSSEPALFLQNVMKRGPNFVGLDVLILYHYTESGKMINRMLASWIWHNANPTEEEAFLLKTYLHSVTQNAVKLLLNGRQQMRRDEQNLMYFYAKALKGCQSVDDDGTNLDKKLAKIDGMRMVVTNFCQFLSFRNSDGGIKQIEHEFGSTFAHVLGPWYYFCKKYLGPMPMLLAAKVGTAIGEGRGTGKEIKKPTSNRDQPPAAAAVESFYRPFAAAGGMDIFSEVRAMLLADQIKRRQKKSVLHPNRFRRNVSC